MIDYEIMFDDSKKYRLVTYFNADWAADTKNQKSTMGFLIKIVRASVHWRSIKQTDVSLSTTETEYIAVSETAKNVVIICRILHELNIISEDFAFLLLINNISMIAVSESEKVTRNARHIDIHYHHIQDLIEKKIIKVSHIPMSGMAADGLTKTLLSNKFKEFVELIEVLKIEFSNSKSSNSEPSDGEPNNSESGEASDGNKNNENFVVNYYEETEEVSFKTEEAE